MSFRSFAGVATVAVSLGWLCIAWYLRQPEQLAGRLCEQLAMADDQHVEPLLRSLASLGEPGLPALADALASQRACVRQIARQVLVEEIDRWELLPAENIEQRLAALAHALAASAPHMDIENRRLAADLAMRLILWPRAADSGQCTWLTDCESVLADAVERKRPAQTMIDPAVARSVLAAGSSGQSIVPLGFADSGTSLPEKVQLPGGDLPLEMAPMPEVGGFVEPHIVHVVHAAAPPIDSRQPGRLEVPSNTRSLDGDDSDDDGDETDGNASGSAGGANHPARLPADARRARRMQSGLEPERQTVATTRAEQPVAWHNLEPRDVMRRLHASDERVVLAARVELERRGITGPLVDVARRATDPDPEVRRSLVESLPSMPGVDAKPWLIQLSYDDDPQVRRGAVALMATSGDLEMVGRLEQISRDDPDEFIRSQAAKAVRPPGRGSGP